ncbi:MAG: DUF6588 family protein [Reichenbachiella sp.]|uniref:DUF6588 family protein n=1 Tax=Reichenbachiella sp. TaxID=2184521 RepID=UPI0032673674
MRLNFTKSTLILCLSFLFLSGQHLSAQSLQDAEALDLTPFLKAGEEDASKLIGAYMSPMFTGIGFGVANGWYNTAKPHKPLGFDITATVSLAKAPSEDLFFTFLNSEYNNISLANGTSADLASVFGGDNTVGMMTNLSGTDQNGNSYTASSSFTSPPGIPLGDEINGYVPVPMIQAGIGLIKNTDLKIRWMPTQKSSEYGYEIKMFGVGIMHDFKQWIPGIKHIPIDMSVLVGYNRISTTLDFIDSVIPGTNQGGEFSVNALTYQILVSKKLSILTLYGGFGYNSVTTDFKILGTYQIQGDNDISGSYIELVDPVQEEYKSDGMRATAGFRLKLAVITLHADYTLQKYNTITAGLGFSFR